MLMLLTEGQRSDHIGAALLLPHLPHASVLLADRGYDSNRFRAGLADRGITPCIPPMPGRRTELPYDKDLYRQRHKIEIMFGRIKDWRRIAMRYDRCAHTFFSAICIAATLTFWLRSESCVPHPVFWTRGCIMRRAVGSCRGERRARRAG